MISTKNFPSVLLPTFTPLKDCRFNSKLPLSKLYFVKARHQTAGATLARPDQNRQPDDTSYKPILHKSQILRPFGSRFRTFPTVNPSAIHASQQPTINHITTINDTLQSSLPLSHPIISKG